MRYLAFTFAVASSLVILPGAQADSMAGMHMESFSFGAPGDPHHVQRTIRIAMGDMSFEPKIVTVQAGETIRFIVANKSDVEHDFTIGDAATQVAHRKEMAEMVEKSGMGEMHHADANGILVKPHATGTLTWKFGKPAELEFDCDLPGHFEAGMAGTLIVK